MFPFDYIAELPVKPLSLRLLLVLDQMNSVFVTGKFPSVWEDNIGAEIRRFLWAVSMEFTPDEKARRAFIKKVDDLDAGEVLAGIRDYVGAAFADAPGNAETKQDAPYASTAAQMIDAFADAYGWLPETVLEMPLAQLWQLRNCISARTEKNPVFFNREIDEFNRNRLRSQHAHN